MKKTYLILLLVTTFLLSPSADAMKWKGRRQSENLVDLNNPVSRAAHPEHFVAYQRFKSALAGLAINCRDLARAGSALQKELSEDFPEKEDWLKELGEQMASHQRECEDSLNELNVEFTDIHDLIERTIPATANEIAKQRLAGEKTNLLPLLELVEQEGESLVAYRKLVVPGGSMDRSLPMTEREFQRQLGGWKKRLSLVEDYDEASMVSSVHWYLLEAKNLRFEVMELADRLQDVQAELRKLSDDLRR